MSLRILIFIAFVFCPLLMAVEETEPAKKPVTEKAAEEKPKIPGFKIDIKKKVVRMEAEVCLTSGLLEYLVCLPHTFEHEAIFVTKGKPQLLHAALLMIGREPTQLMKEQFKWWEVIKKKPKSRLDIKVEWKDEQGKLHSIPFHKLLSKRGVKKEDKEEDKYAKDYWFFNGSCFIKGRYAATEDATVVAVQPMVTSVIQYGIDEGNPYSGEDVGFEINSKMCPPYGTKVELVFTGKKEEKKKKE